MRPTTSCTRCGTDLDSTAAFCPTCGLARTPAPGTGGTRRALFNDPVLDALRQITAGEYDIGGRLGVGGMASVYLARELRLNRRVAIKAMLPELLEKEHMVERFFDEARKQARLEHRNIVPIYSLHWNDDLPFFVMKFVDGYSADDVTRARGALPIPVVQHILNGTIAALQFAHDEGVIHRDVKPGNVLIDRRGEPIVSDFGIAKAAESPHLTQTGAAIGTPAYMSPEQCRGLPVTPASDQYSVGILAFQLLTGSTPFTGSMLDLLQAHSLDSPPSILEQCPDCPSRLASAIMRMLEKSPEDRWPELRDALPDLLDGFGTEADARRQLVALFPDRPTAAEALPVTPLSPTPAVSGPRKKSAPAITLIVAPADGNWELGIGKTVQMVARRSGDTAAGNTAANVSWETTDAAIATVTPTGSVTAHALGPVSIVATEGGLTGRCELTVVADAAKSPSGTAPLRVASDSTPTPATPARRTPIGERETTLIPIQGPSSDGEVGESAAAAATTAADSEMTPAAPTKSGRTNRLAIGAGAAVILAGVIFFATRTSGPPPAPAPVTAVVPRPDSVPATAKPDTTAAAPAATPVVVSAARVSLILTRVEMKVGDSVRAVARAFDTGGQRIPGVVVALTSSEPSVATVDSSGLVVARGAGTASITARSGTARASQAVTVTPRQKPLTVAEATDAITPVVALISEERWNDVQHMLQADVLEALKGKRRIVASLSGEPRIVHSTLDSATVDFDVAMTWVNFARLGRSGQALLRAKLGRSAQVWRVSEVSAREKLP